MQNLGEHNTYNNEMDDVATDVPEPTTEVLDPLAQVTLGRLAQELEERIHVSSIIRYIVAESMAHLLEDDTRLVVGLPELIEDGLADFSEAWYQEKQASSAKTDMDLSEDDDIVLSCEVAT